MISATGDVPPPAVTESRVDTTIKINASFSALTAVALILRMFSRGYIIRSFGADDYLIFLGGLSALGVGITGIEGTKYGFGLHNDEVHGSETMLMSFFKVLYAGSLLYSAAMMFIKLSILMFYLRLQPKPMFTYTIYGIIAFVTGMGVASLLVNIFQCTPVAYTWDLSLNGTCIHRNSFYYAHAVLNIISDFAVYFMAIPIVNSVQLPKRQKRGLYFILGLGAFVCVASIVRMFYLHSVSHSVDSTWDLVDPYNWSTIEADVSVFCACIPSFTAIIRRYWPKALGMLSNVNNSYLPGKQSTGGGAMESSRNRDRYSINASNAYYEATCAIEMENSKAAEPRSELTMENNINGSEECIVTGNDTNIYKTTDFTVSVHDANGEEALARSDSDSELERRPQASAV
ncbi:hypothetical protein BDZ91DRAFT_461176 [Kalaharituber pfeilii]|nr:hypothetical protein BDZ91DRAFT_461176 [Kalaharituber pfeilii]